MLTMQGGDSLVGGLPIIHITYQQYIANPSAYHDPDVIVHISGFPTAGNMPADYVGYDSNLNMEDIGNIATKAIAKVEPSDTALYLHEVGTGFINKDGNYCITDVQISVGGTITLGTNCHVVDGGISSNLSPQDITSQCNFNPAIINGGKVIVNKSTKTIYINIATTNNAIPNNSTWFTIPNEYPITGFVSLGTFINSNNTMYIRNQDVGSNVIVNINTVNTGFTTPVLLNATITYS